MANSSAAQHPHPLQNHISKKAERVSRRQWPTLLTGLLVFAAQALPEKAFAWGDTGHEVVGEIAERLLSVDPTTMNSVQSIIGLEPLQVSATWPDRVRSDERFSEFAPYHFTTNFKDPHKHSEKDLNTVLNKYPPLLVDRSIPAAEQAMALRFIVHMVGDTHQPLHVGNEFDRGGNNCSVQFSASGRGDGSKMNLHFVWDTAIINAMINDWKREYPDVKYFGATDIARILMAKYPDILAGPVSVDPQEWMAESTALRKSGIVYPDQLDEDKRPYCMKKAGEISPAEMPRLGPEYFVSAREVVEKQLVKAGVRLAAFLKLALRNRESAVVDQDAILRDLLKTNDEQSMQNQKFKKTTQLKARSKKN